MPEGSEPGTELQRWSDVAMYTAAPAVRNAGKGTEGEQAGPLQPVVTLVAMTDMPVFTMAAAAELYGGRVFTRPDDVPEDEARKWLDDMTRTKLATPLEYINLHFLIENVSRAFTHQLVRQRTGVAYVQESQRFAVKKDVEWAVYRPPSIPVSEDNAASRIWDNALNLVGEAYLQLVEMGIPAEDARGLLPTNIMTKIHWQVNMRALLETAGARLCTQAQFEWRSVFAMIAKAIRGRADRARPHRGERWEFDALADLLRPVCYLTGKCEFMAQADRYCGIRDKVEAFHRAGVMDSDKRWDSAQWNVQQFNPLGLRQIIPAEWLLIPGSARTKDPNWRKEDE